MKLRLLTLLVSAAALSASCNDNSFSGGSKEPAQPKAATVEPIDADSLGKAQEDETPAPVKSKEPIKTETKTKKAGAVSEGSFTAWAEPSNPGTLQDYDIFIEIDLKKDASSYKLDDLSGRLTGTDAFTQEIPTGRRSTGLPNAPFDITISGQKATVKMRVPGAFYPSTLDTVSLHSKALNENATLKIQFKDYFGLEGN